MYIITSFVTVPCLEISVVPKPQAIDLTQTATFTCSATGYNISYSWINENKSESFPDKVMGTNSNTLMIPNVRSTDAGKYCCNYRNNACTKSRCSTLIVKGVYNMYNHTAMHRVKYNSLNHDHNCFHLYRQTEGENICHTKQ